MIDLTGRVALVTGGGSGIGRATALMLAKVGARVAILDVHAEAAEAVAGEVGAAGGAAEVVVADVTDSAAIAAAVGKVVEHMGGLDIVVANAGTSDRTAVVDMDDATWDALIAADLDSVFYTARAAIPALERSRYGRLICTSSHHAIQGEERFAHYAAAKAGILGLVRTLALELGPAGVTVNAVAPGPVVTPLAKRTPEQVRAWETRLPLGRLGQPEDVAGAILFLASDLASWISGEALQVNGGAYFQ